MLEGGRGAMKDRCSLASVDPVDIHLTVDVVGLTRIKVSLSEIPPGPACSKDLFVISKWLFCKCVNVRG